MKRTIYILTGIIVVLAVAIVGILIFMKNQPPETRGIKPLVVIEEMEPEFFKVGG